MTQSKYVDTYKDFISENRIFAGIRKSSDPLADMIGFYIYDFSGKEIAYKDACTIVKRPYMYGKAIFIKDYYTYRAVGYLDMNGNEHVIPYRISPKDDSGKTIEIKDVDCELLTSNILRITDGLRDTIIDLNGSLIECERLDGFFGIAPGIYLKEVFCGDLIVYNSESKEIFRCNYLEKDSIYVVY